MSRLRISSELREAATLLGEIAEVSRARTLPSRGERLQRVLSQLCTRAGLRGAAVADDQGLPLAVYNAPYRVDVLGAVASILGHALAHAAKVLDEGAAHTITMDLGLDEKVVVRRFDSGDDTYYLVVVCPSELDERSEVEVSLTQLASIVGARAGVAGGAG